MVKKNAILRLRNIEQEGAISAKENKTLVTRYSLHEVTRFRLASSLASFNTTNALYMEISRQLMTVSEGNSEFWGSKTHYFPLGRSSRVL